MCHLNKVFYFFVLQISTSTSRYLSLPKNTKLPEKLQKKKNISNAGIEYSWSKKTLNLFISVYKIEKFSFFFKDNEFSRLQIYNNNLVTFH